MARIRSVHPDICTDEALALASAGAERLFVRLWTHLDDEGRCVDSPLILKGTLFPLHIDITPHDVTLWIDELVALRCLFRYSEGGKNYLTAKSSWKVWQKPRHPSPSKLPAPADQVFTADRRDTPEAYGGTSQGEVGVGGEERSGAGGEGESEGETALAVPDAEPVDNCTPLRNRIYLLEQDPPEFGSGRVVATPLEGA